MRDAIRERKFRAKEANGTLSFSDCADRYVERYIRCGGYVPVMRWKKRLELLKQRTE
jgi:hypothetical protein